MKLLVFICIFFLGCISGRQPVVSENIAISLNQTACGSLEVKNNETTIGYVVRDVDLSLLVKTKAISQSEELLIKTYNKYYSRFQRVYLFKVTRLLDTVLLTVMLSKQQTDSILDWNCKEQDLNTYQRGSPFWKDPSHNHILAYNFTKNRFNLPSEND
jgi:hypothetical protein